MAFSSRERWKSLIDRLQQRRPAPPHYARRGAQNGLRRLRTGLAQGADVRIDRNPGELPRYRVHLIDIFMPAEAKWSLSSLVDALTARGLTFRPGPRTAARPVAANQLHKILRNRYYLGIVRWRGVEYEGKHPALVDAVTFERVQQKLSDHRASGERGTRRDHYLVGSLRCGLCGDRMLYTVAKGRNQNEYGYFYCSSRLRSEACGQRYLPEALVEQAVENQWSLETVPAQALADLQVELRQQIEEHEGLVGHELETLEQRAHAIRRERFKWAEKVMAGAIPDDVAATKQQSLAKELGAVEAEIAQRKALRQVDREALSKLFDLMADAGTAYLHADATLRRSLNRVWFKYLVITEDQDGLTVTDATREPLTAAVRAAMARRELQAAPKEPKTPTEPI